MPWIAGANGPRALIPTGLAKGAEGPLVVTEAGLNMKPTSMTPDAIAIAHITGCQCLDSVRPSGKYIGRKASAATTPGTHAQLLSQFHHSAAGTQWPPAVCARLVRSPLKSSTARIRPTTRMTQPTRFPAALEMIRAPTLA